MAIRRCSSTYLATWGGPVCRRFSLYFSTSLFFSLCVSLSVSLTLVALFFLTNCGNFICCTAWIEAQSNLLPRRQQISHGLRLMCAATKATIMSASLPLSLLLSLYLLLCISLSVFYCFPLSLSLSLCLLFHVCLKTLERISRLPSPFSRFSFETLLPRLLTNFSHIFVMSSWFFSSWNETEIKSEH